MAGRSSCSSSCSGAAFGQTSSHTQPSLLHASGQASGRRRGASSKPWKLQVGDVAHRQSCYDMAVALAVTSHECCHGVLQSCLTAANKGWHSPGLAQPFALIQTQRSRWTA